MKVSPTSTHPDDDITSWQCGYCGFLATTPEEQNHHLWHPCDARLRFCALEDARDAIRRMIGAHYTIETLLEATYDTVEPEACAALLAEHLGNEPATDAGETDWLLWDLQRWMLDRYDQGLVPWLTSDDVLADAVPGVELPRHRITRRGVAA